MNKEPLVSVVIPVYNGEQYVKSCLDMMMTQSYKNLEIIVVNDGSADHSAALTNGYQVKLINHEQNRGLSAARNTGIDAATGEFIHFMDVDDTINIDYYQALVAAIIDTAADIACGGMVNKARIHKAQRFTKRVVYDQAYRRLEATYVGKIGYVWRYLFKIDFLKANNLRFQEGRLMEDLMFSLPALYFANRLVVVPDAVYVYCQQPNSIMTSNNPIQVKKRREDRKYAIGLMHKFAKDYHIEIPGVTTGKLRYIIKKWLS